MDYSKSVVSYCPGWNCNQEGLFCADYSGSAGLGYCCKNKKWVSGSC